MVTVIQVTPSEAAALLATSASSSAAAAINKDTAEKNTQLCNDPSSTDQEQHASLSFENDAHSDDGRETKRGLQALDPDSSKQMKKKRQKHDRFIIDLSDVPPQTPLPKSAGSIKEGLSKYAGVSYDKRANKWTTKIQIDGKQRHIGYYVNEEEAAVDYARAFYKYRSQEALAKERKRKSFGSGTATDFPQQQPILKSAGRVNKGTSKYAGVYFNQTKNKWIARVWFDGKDRHIGCYEDEEEAASDYARALVKYYGCPKKAGR